LHIVRGLVSLFLLVPGTLLLGQDTHWPQFRGPNASGVTASDAPLPVEFGPARRVLWKQALPPGHSSPVIWGDRIFLTAFDKESSKLEVLCLARKNGSILWRRPLAVEKLEKVHVVSNPASATPAVDGESVYVYFGSLGLLAFDLEGKQRWSLPLPLPKMTQSSGTSPVVAGELVILNRDEMTDGYLLAVDRKSGKTVWKQPYPVGIGRQAESYSTPVIWHDQAILHRAGFVEGYDLKDGRRKWWVRAQTSGTSTVVVDRDTVYAATWSPIGEADQFVPLPSFAELLKKHDKDGDGRLTESEFPKDLPIISRPDTPNVPGATIFASLAFKSMIDQNHDGVLQQSEWEGFQTAVKSFMASHGLVAIKPSAEGDVTSSVVWTEKTAIPEVPSPLLYDGRLYMVRNGGIVTCLNPKSGSVLFRTRLGAGGPYYSSPIAANGRVYIASGEGTVVVLAAGDKPDVIARNELREEIFSTPAVAAGTLYVRTSGNLYAFGEK
jgi:outer membrane protein assembly factor BamB